VTWRFPSVTKSRKTRPNSATLASWILLFRRWTYLCTLILYFVDFVDFVSFYLRVSQIFCGDLLFLFIIVLRVCRMIGNSLAILGILRLTEYRWREKTAGIENRKRRDGGQIDRGAQHSTGRIARRWYRFAFRYLCFCSKYVLSPHIIGAWRWGREDSGRGWPLYAQMSARDSTTELAEPFQDRSAARVGSGGNDYGGTPTSKGESPVNLRFGRASAAARSNSAR